MKKMITAFTLVALSAPLFAGAYNKMFSNGYLRFNYQVAELPALEQQAREELTQQLNAIAAVPAGEYTFEKKYVEEFEQEDYIYQLNRGEEFSGRMDELYGFFSNWLAGWEL